MKKGKVIGLSALGVFILTTQVVLAAPQGAATVSGVPSNTSKNINAPESSAAWIAAAGTALAGIAAAGQVALNAAAQYAAPAAEAVAEVSSSSSCAVKQPAPLNADVASNIQTAFAR